MMVSALFMSICQNKAFKRYKSENLDKTNPYLLSSKRPNDGGNTKKNVDRIFYPVDLVKYLIITAYKENATFCWKTEGNNEEILLVRYFTLQGLGLHSGAFGFHSPRL